MAKIEEQQKAIHNLKSNLMDDLNDKGILSDPQCQKVIEMHQKVLIIPTCLYRLSFICLSVYLCVCVRVCVRACMHMCVSVYIYIYIYIYIYTMLHTTLLASLLATFQLKENNCDHSNLQYNCDIVECLLSVMWLI